MQLSTGSDSTALPRDPPPLLTPLLPFIHPPLLPSPVRTAFHIPFRCACSCCPCPLSAPSAAPCELVYNFGVFSNGDGCLRRRTGCGREPSSPLRGDRLCVCVCVCLGWCCAYLSVACSPPPLYYVATLVLGAAFPNSKSSTRHRSYVHACGSTLENGHYSCCAPILCL